MAGQVRENWAHAYMKVPYPFRARNGFSLPLILLVYRDQYRMARKEYGRLVWLYTLENLLLCLPSLFTFSRHIYPHSLVTPLDAEKGVSIASYVLIIFFPGRRLIENYLLKLFPSPFHPDRIPSVETFRNVQSACSCLVKTFDRGRSRRVVGRRDNWNSETSSHTSCNLSQHKNI